MIAHGGCGKKDDVLDLFNKTDVDGISISSMFHYFYYKNFNKFQKKDTKNSINYSNFFEGDSIENLKKYLIKNKIEIRS